MKARTVAVICALAAHADGAARPSAAQGRHAGAEFAILLAVHLSVAEVHCPVRIDESRLRRLLEQHGLALRDVFGSSRSPGLEAEIGKIAQTYKTDRSSACEAAWRNFGPEGLYEGFLQRR